MQEINLEDIKKMVSDMIEDKVSDLTNFREWRSFDSATDVFSPLTAASSRISFFGNQLQSKKTINGAKGGNGALTSLLSALSSYGLITDSTT